MSNRRFISSASDLEPSFWTDFKRRVLRTVFSSVMMIIFFLILIFSSYNSKIYLGFTDANFSEFLRLFFWGIIIVLLLIVLPTAIGLKVVRRLKWEYTESGVTEISPNNRNQMSFEKIERIVIEGKWNPNSRRSGSKVAICTRTISLLFD